MTKDNGKLKKTIIIISSFAVLLFIIYNFIDIVNIIKSKNKNVNKTWSSKQVDEMIHNSINDIYSESPSLKDYPVIVHDYCKCTIDTLLKHYTYDEIWEMEKLPLNVRKQKFEPIFKKCLVKFQIQLKPFEKEIRHKEKIRGCASRAVIKIGDSLKALNYCNCIIDYIEAKYGDGDSLNMDSIKQIEKVQINKCYENALLK